MHSHSPWLVGRIYIYTHTIYVYTGSSVYAQITSNSREFKYTLLNKHQHITNMLLYDIHVHVRRSIYSLT